MSGARRLSNAPIAANVTLYNRGGKVVTHRLGWAIAIAVGLAGGASAQPPRVAPPPPAASVVTQLQAAYNAAQGAYDAGQWAQANDGFARVLASIDPTSRSAGMIRVRRADALAHLQRSGEARQEAAAGVATLKALATGPDEDVAVADLMLGDILRLDLDCNDAITAYSEARIFAAGDGKADQVDLADVGIIQSAMVIQPELAASTADAMIAESRFSTMTNSWRAQIYTLRARAALNMHDLKAAKRFSDQALALTRAVTASSIGIADVVVRADAALIYAQLKDFESVRLYLTATGAGHLPDEQWFGSASSDSPICGPLIGPDDSAVVEFAIADDGRAVGAAPVYASRPGPMGVEFARSVKEWRWDPAAVAKAHAFWRTAVRVQLRCQTKPPPLSLAGPFTSATKKWFQEKGFDDFPLLKSGVAPSADIRAITQLWTRLDHGDGGEQQRATEGKQLDLLLVGAGAPVEVRAVAVSVVAEGGAGLHEWGSRRARMLEAMTPAIEGAPGGQHAAAWLRVEQAVALETSSRFQDAVQPLNAVLALPTTVLPSDDPIREVAVLHMSLIDKRLGQPEAALALQAASDLTPHGCSLLDVRPIPTQHSASGDDFPDDAQRWGFEGWVRTGFDIDADGRPTDVRVLIAYPPFVFDDAAVRIASRFRYLPPSLGTTPLSCAGEVQAFKFIPYRQ